MFLNLFLKGWLDPLCVIVHNKNVFFKGITQDVISGNFSLKIIFLSYIYLLCFLTFFLYFQDNVLTLSIIPLKIFLFFFFISFLFLRQYFFPLSIICMPCFLSNNIVSRNPGFSCLASGWGMLVSPENQNREIQNAFNIMPRVNPPVPTAKPCSRRSLEPTWDLTPAELFVKMHLVGDKEISCGFENTSLGE